MKSIFALLVAAAVGGLAVFVMRSAGGHVVPDRTAIASSAMTDGAASKAKPFWTCGMHPQVIQDHAGACPICHMKLTPLKDDTDEEAIAGAGGKRKVLYYWDPMLGLSSIAHAPGKSAMGMELVPVYEADVSAGPTVRIDPTIVQNIGVRTAEVVRGPLDVTVRTIGMLEVPEPAFHEVNLKINGWIQTLYANAEGMRIHKGDPLFDLYSPDIQVAAEELIGASKAFKQLDAAAPESVRTESKAMLASVTQKLRLWGISDDDIAAITKADIAPRTIPFRSPVDGELVEKMVVEGSAVQSGLKLMRIEDHTKLWLNARVYQGQMPAVAVGQMVDATVDGVPGMTFTSRITFIDPHVDHMTRTTTVRVELDNLKHELRPGMYATANIVTKPVADAVIVPREAVIDTGKRQIAFVAMSEGHFNPRKVRMGISGDGDRVQILEGLAPGEMVVTSGQFLMDVESRTSEAIEKLRRGSAPTEQPAPTQTAASAMKMIGSTTIPAARSAPSMTASTLVVARCPMKNADWLQIGTEISNPYFGTMMATCGSVTTKIDAPMKGSPLDAVADHYLLVAKSFDADKLDGNQIQPFKVAADKLPSETFAPLHQSIGKLAEATELESARTAFQSVSAEMIAALQKQPMN